MTDAAAPATADPAVTAFRRAKALADIGRLDDALAAVAEGLGQFPDDSAMLTLQAWLLLKAERPAEAKPLLHGLVASQPDDALIIFLLSAAHGALEEYDAARRTAERALELDPQSARYHLQVAFLAVTGTIGPADRRLAIERVDSALELEPDSTSTLHSAAEIARALGDLEGANAYVARGLALDPQDQSLLFLRAVLLGDAAPGSPGEQGAVPRAAAQVGAMSHVLGASPDSVEAGQVLLGRVWGQLLRLVDAPLITVAVVVLSIGFGMGNGPTLGLLFVGAGAAVAWPAFRALTARAVLRRAPQGYVRRMVRGGVDAGPRLISSAVVVGASVVGVLGLLVVREASLVRWLLLVLSVGSVAGGVASVLWYKRYLDAALESGIFRPTSLGFRSIRIARSTLSHGVGRRAGVLLLSTIPATLILLSPRDDAAPVLLVAVAAWTAPLVYALWRVRRLSLELGGDGDAPPGVTPSVAGGPLLGAITLALAAVAVLGLAMSPWLPSERDAAGTYSPDNPRTTDCEGRPASRLACLLQERQEQLEEEEPTVDAPEVDVPPIDIPEFEVPEIDIPSLPPLPTIAP